MANIDPAPSWADIRQLETTDRNLAGPGGVLNTQPTSIAARLNLLRNNATALNNTVTGVSSRQDAADSAIASLQSQVIDAPGTLSDLDHGAAISVSGDQFPDVLSIDNSRGPVLALNESIADLAQRDEWSKAQIESSNARLDATEEIVDDIQSPTGAQLVGWGSRNISERILDLGISLADYPSLFEAMTAAADAGKTLIIPAGEHVGEDVVFRRPISMDVTADAFLNLNLEISGTPYYGSDTVNLVGDWLVFPVGTTSFSGDFSAYAAGEIVAFELPDGGSASQGNEAGLDFLTVQSASSTTLVTTTGLRWPYRNPKVSKVTGAVKTNLSLARETYLIPGDYTALFQIGDVIRIENVDGTDGVEASKAYFELSRVVEITTSAITLEHSMRCNHVNPWIIRTNVVTGVKISGSGRIRRLRIDCCADAGTNGVDVDRYVARLVYNINGDFSWRRGVSEPSTSNMTWCFYGHANTVLCGGSSSTTDNAAFKFMSCPGVDFIGVRGQNNRATGAQGNFGVFGDYFYTPYRIWNDNVRVQARADTPRSPVTRAAWFTGMRDSYVEYTGAQPFLQRSIDTTFVITSPSFLLEMQDLVRCTVVGNAASVTFDGGVDNTIDITVRNSRPASNGRRFWARGGSIHPETGAAYTATNNLGDCNNLSTNPTDTTFYIQNQTGFIIGNKSRDKIGLANSVQFGAGVVEPKMLPNFLTNAIPINAGWQGPRNKGYMRFDGDYRDGGIFLGNMAYWSNTDKLYTKAGKPTLGADGIVVGTQT